MTLKTLHLLIFGLTGSAVYCQNLENIGKEKPVKVNGGLSINQTMYNSSDSIARRDPYNYYINGNLNFSLYGWSIPFSFNYSNQKATFTQPFNNYSLHPQYKWMRFHVGYTSMNFSPYTLNGHLFLGAGAELTPPGPFSMSMMYGRLKRASEFDSLTAHALPPEFERWGYGMKAGYTYSNQNNLRIVLELNMFHAKDNAMSLSQLPDSMLYPGQNMVVGGSTQISFAGRYTLAAEVASSALSKNINSTVPESGIDGFNRIMGSLIGSNGTTEYYVAGKINLNYNAEFYSIGAGYERIDPGYETYGAYYFNNDMQNITLNGSMRLLENRVNVSGSIGRQNDNLDQSKASELKRWVNALNIGFNPGERLNSNFSYSTFTSYTNIRSQFVEINQLTPYDNLDTLNFTQLSSTLSTSLSYILKNTDKVRQNINFNFSRQNSSEEQNGLDTLGGSNFYNLSSAYGFSIVPTGLTISVALMSSINKMPGMNTSTFGPSLSVNKLMLNKKLRNSVTCSYNTSQSDGVALSRVLSMRLGSGYRVGKRHNFNLGIIIMNRKSMKNADTRAVREFIANLAYSVSF